MLFTDVLKMDSKLTVPNIQKAFHWTVERLRLDPVLLAVRLIGRKNFHSWENPFLNELGSQFQIRQINEVMNGKLDGVPQYKAYATNDQCVVGDIRQVENQYGFSSQLSSTTTYIGNSFSILDNTIECTTSNNVLMFLNCHQYPYLVRHSSSPDPFTTKHVYDIQSMIDMYGVNNLVVDNALMMPVLLVAKSFMEDDMMNISSSQNLLHIATRMINLYNRNQQSIGLEGDGASEFSIIPTAIKSNGAISYGTI